MINNLKEILITEFSKYNISLTEQQTKQFLEYKCLLQEENKKINLTTIDDDIGIIYKHFLDSVTIGTCFDFKTISTVADLGTGAGLPGIPLKIVYPHLHFTLLDATLKKINFIREVINILNLENVNLLWSRIESLSKNIKYDLVVARALAKLPVLLEYSLPFVKIGGYFIAYKQSDIQTELDSAQNALLLLGGKLVKQENINISNGNDLVPRCLLIFKKIKSTPEKYPRSAKLINKNPLKQFKLHIAHDRCLL